MDGFHTHCGDEILTCDECGALVEFASRDRHQDWHSWLVTADELEAMRPRRRWVLAEHRR